MDKIRKILVIDDDQETRDMYADILREAGFQVAEAQDGLEGLDSATRETPDAIFTGIIMPRMDGFTMMEALKKNVATSSIPVIVSSHMGREEDRQKAVALGAKDFIVRYLTSPKEAADRIRHIFESAGSAFFVDFDAYAMDAQKLARESGINDDFQCMNCSQKMSLKLTSVPDSGDFKAKFVCQNCGWEKK